jgi:plastocyanin
MGGRRLAVLTVIALAVVGLTACGGSSNKPKELSVLQTTNELRFKPDSFKVRFNQETVFTLQNTDKSRTHNFTLTEVFVDPDHFVSVDVPPGQTRQVKFTVTQRPAPGFFTFYCRFHQGSGMSGRITLS